jgi:hypothetical protein
MDHETSNLIQQESEAHTTPVPQSHKPIFKKPLFWAFLVAILAAGVGVYIGFINKKSSRVDEVVSKPKVPIVQETTKKPISGSESSFEEAPDESKMDGVVDIESVKKQCAKQVEEPGNYEPGQVVISLHKGVSIPEVKTRFREYGFDIDGTSLEEPTDVILKWEDGFLNSPLITLDEVNNFLAQIRSLPYIEAVEIPSEWHSWPVTKEQAEFVQLIDRLGYFVLTFNDQNKKDEFFSEFSQATFFADGKPRGVYIDTSQTKTTILFKAERFMDNLEDLREEVSPGLPVLTIPDILPGMTIDRPVLYINDSQRNQDDTNYINSIAVAFPSDFSPSEIKRILSKYPGIDSDNSIITERGSSFDLVIVEVPEGQEECWATALEEDSYIDFALTNNYMELF